WIGSDINYSVQSSSQDISFSMTDEKLIPKDEGNQWFLYDDENIIQQLLQSLNDRGIREHNLFVNLKKVMPFIHNEFEQTKKSKNSIEQQDENIETSYDIISSFKSELEDIETRLRLGSLGGFIINENLNEWQIKLKQSIERIDLAELLIQLQQTVADKYAIGIFNLPDKKSLQIWINDCRTCKTYSRLYVLMMIFENSITWNKSTLGIKCKICRKKHKDEYIIVCDQCCYGFHQECLRDYSDNITNSTNDLWYCPACRPSSTTKRRIKQVKQKIDHYETDIYDDDMEVETTSNTSSHERNNHDVTDSNTDNDDDNENDDNSADDEDHVCSICSVENDLIQCTQCHQYYHCQCHEPPLRCPPRSTTWICNNCRNGHNNEINHSSRQSKTKKQIKKSKEKNRIKSQKHNETRRSARKNYREIDEDEEEEEEESNEEEKTTTAQRRSKRLRRSDPSPIKNIDNNQNTRRRTRIEKSITSSSDDDQMTNNHNEDSDIEKNEDEEENENNSNDSPSSD
ncbi:unnamed protein product, partial [Rotaria sp. Silwood2]